MARNRNNPTTQDLLNKKLDLINHMLGLPTEPCTPDGKGGYVWNPGVFHLDHAYNGCSLVRMSLHGGSGTETMLHTGFISKPAMLAHLEGFVKGMQVMQAHMESKG